MWCELLGGFIWKLMDQAVPLSLRGVRIAEDVTCCSFSFTAATVICILDEGM